MTSPPTSQERMSFYRAAVVGLRALDARESTPRRLGADAEARWTQFAGALGAGDRIDILLRDAAGSWGAAFSPSDCFGLFGLAPDEPFGPDWGGIDDDSAKRLIAEAAAPTMEHAARSLGVALTNVAVPALTPSTKLIVAGGAAVVAAARAFADDRALSWSDQVVVVADDAACRQLAGLAAVIGGARRKTTLVRPTGAVDDALRAAGFAHVDAAVVSPDAEAAAAAVARKVGGR